MHENAEQYHNIFQVQNKIIKQIKTHNSAFHIVDPQVSEYSTHFENISSAHLKVDNIKLCQDFFILFYYLIQYLKYIVRTCIQAISDGEKIQILQF